MPIEWDKYELDDSQVTEIREAIDQDIEGLERKNGELIDRNKRLNQKYEHTLETHKGVTEKHNTQARQITELQEELESLRGDPDAKGGKGSGEGEKALALKLKRMERDLESLSSERDNYAGQLREATLTGQLEEALNETNIKPTARRAVRALMRQGIDWVDGQPTVDGMTVKEHLISWASTDEGKDFVAAPHSSGSGSQGAGHRANGKAVAKTREDLPTPEMRAAFISEHGSEKYLQVMGRNRG